MVLDEHYIFHVLYSTVLFKQRIYFFYFSFKSFLIKKKLVVRHKNAYARSILLFTMDSFSKLVTPLGIVIDVILSVAFFVYMASVVASHVPLPVENYPIANPAITYATSACLSGVFWLALGCFRVTWKDYVLRRKGGCGCSKSSCS